MIPPEQTKKENNEVLDTSGQPEACVSRALCAEAIAASTADSWLCQHGTLTAFPQAHITLQSGGRLTFGFFFFHWTKRTQSTIGDTQSVNLYFIPPFLLQIKVL